MEPKLKLYEIKPDLTAGEIFCLKEVVLDSYLEALKFHYPAQEEQTRGSVLRMVRTASRRALEKGTPFYPMYATEEAARALYGILDAAERDLAETLEERCKEADAEEHPFLYLPESEEHETLCSLQEKVWESLLEEGVPMYPQAKSEQE